MAAFQPDELERKILELWERERTFERSVERRAGSPRFSFYDGPPYATGSPHYGHLLQTTIKDAVTRYWTMRGRRVDRRVGWDCHGLPVENLVEKELGLKTKKDIEEMGSTLDADSGGGTGSPQAGIEQFNATCRSFVLRKVDEWTALLRRVGRWADYTQAYVTMDSTYIESVWWVFKTVWERGLVYKGMRSSPYCPRCETPLSNFETTLGYRDVADPAVTLKLPLVDDPSTFLLIWTTTPWTLPANAAVAVHPDLRYVRARVGDETWIVAKDRVAEVIQEEHVVADEFAGSTLVGLTYEPLYTFLEPDKPAFRVVAAPFVSSTEGTGLVHIAPAFGEDDFRLAEEEDLPILQTVDEHGRFVAAVTPWTGRFVKDADSDIMHDLDQRGLFLRSETIRHAYPFCWRCETPLLYMATTSWFISVSKIKDQLLRNAEAITWVPAHLKDGRFGQGLRDAPDWAISRTRYWGTPLPVWECASCGTATIVGSLADLQNAGGDLSLLRSPHANPDLHRPYVDRVVLRCRHCGHEARRVPDVLDVWFDSGSMPYGQWHYPFENKELVEQSFPADFIGEALEMTRGWFYTLHVLAGILTLPSEGAGVHPSTSLGVNLPAFKNVVATGLILAEDGRKLSKRLGNYPDPSGVVAKYGADTVRLYLLSATRIGDDLRFSDHLVGELYRRFTLLLWNVWQYYRTYSEGNMEREMRNEDATYSSFRIPHSVSLLDRWILARAAVLVGDVQRAMDRFHVDNAARALIPFVEDLSTWYVRRSRGREEALPVLREVLRTLSLVAAPFIPFFSEHMHRELTGTSPHLEDFPLPEAETETPGARVVLDRMRVIRELAAAGHRARAEAKVKVRQPLAEVVLVGDFPSFTAAGEAGAALLRDELNVKAVRVEKTQPRGEYRWVDAAGGKLGLATALTEELRQEGIVRELIRQVQDLRKQAGYRVDDTITLTVVTDNAIVQETLKRFGDLLRAETKSRELSRQRGEADAAAGVVVAGVAVWIGVARD